MGHQRAKTRNLWRKIDVRERRIEETTSRAKINLDSNQPHDLRAALFTINRLMAKTPDIVERSQKSIVFGFPAHVRLAIYHMLKHWLETLFKLILT